MSEGKPTKLSSIIYKLIFKLHVDGSYDSAWIMCIRNILCDSGNSQFWFDQEALATKIFMKSVLLSHFQSQFLHEWDAEIVRNREMCGI